MKELPLFTLLIPTYNRTEYLGRVLSMFLAQDYKGEKELFFFNDDPDIKLECDHPEVRIVNWPHKISDLSTKTNIGMLTCRKGVVIVFGDDDRMKPWAFSVCVRELGDELCVVVGGYERIYEDGAKGIFKGSMVTVIRTDALKFIDGGYPRLKIISHADVGFQAKLEKAGILKRVELDHDEIWFSWNTVDPTRRDGVWDAPDEKYIEDLNRDSPEVFKIT